MAKYMKGSAQAAIALQVLMVLACLAWYMYWFTLPILNARAWLRSILDPNMDWDFLGTRGSIWLLQIFPWILVAVLAYPVIELRKRIKAAENRTNSEEKPKISIWQQPIILRSPMGMLTLANIIFILVIVFLTVWYTVKSCVDRAKLIDATKQNPGAHSRAQKVEYVGIYLGKAAEIPMTLLWIPVSRASPLLRVTRIPFERAVKYHMWLGSACIWILIAHGLVFVGYYPTIHDISGLWSWPTSGIPPFPGIISLAAGVLMLVTAFEKVRREMFNLFFITHQLYLVFLLFFLFHCQSQMIYVLIPVLLFFLDRFMRMVQSRKAVDVLSTRLLPCGAIELKFAKPANLDYNALSFMYVLFPSISKIEWHPFSVASSPLDGSNQICIYIKPLGEYTKNLHDALVESKEHKEAGKIKCPFGFKLSVEGPYGDESDFFLKKKSLILVAGGIGVTPFLAILRDVLHRHRLQQEDLPTSIKLIFCVRNAKDLCLLDTLNPEDILPGYEERLQITIHAFITSKVEVLKDGELGSMEAGEGVVPYENYRYTRINEHSLSFSGDPVDEVQGMSAMAGSGDTKWVAATVFATVMGCVINWGLFNQFIDHDYANYVRALAMFLAVCGSGGAVMFFWDRSIKNRTLKASTQDLVQSMPPSLLKDGHTHEAGGDIESVGSSPKTPWRGDVTLGKRPDWQGMFDEFAKLYRGKNVGVLVSGGSKMQEDVAAHCKHHNSSQGSEVAFHYHSVSFEL
ncbi:hypothetical protein Mapa_000862 [Marchantia paleacea]|nr:hypothetical protein Mapa_000862 [Marchantia paleacea]